MHNNVKFFTITIISVTIFSCSFHTCLGLVDSDTCNGIFISYNYTGGRFIHPKEDDPAKQPYRFESTLTLLNNGLDELKTWGVFLGFQYDEILVVAENAILDDGSYFPASVGNGTVLRGSPAVSDLKTAVETAGDINKMSVKVNLIGTEFGVEPSDIPMPSNLTLVNEGYSCPSPNHTTGSTEMTLCCTRNLTPESNPSQDEENYSQRQDGDLTIMYDVIKSYDSYYWAQVTIASQNPLGRLDDWNLSWEWQKHEFIYAIKGAYPKLVDTTDCIFGPQGQYYKDFDFSSALNCERIPTIVDLPPTRANDTNLGMIPSCCRNGTILPPSIDKSRSVSVFQMQVYKMPPELNRTRLNPPVNWKINGTMSSDYQCGQPIQVSPSRFPDPGALPSVVSAVLSWQVVCNITKSRETPKCCVSFSAFYNDSLVPCNTCACGCNSITSDTCSPTAPPLLLQPKTILLPFENRTKEAKAWAELKHLPFPNPLPCGDNCGVNINWHVHSDYKEGWTARITVFNWGENDFADWFVAAQFGKAAPGFEKVYSFNGSRYNDTILMQGFPGLNHLLSAKDSSNPRKHPRVPGTQQSVILFNKKNLPRINVAAGDGFPTKVLFNGEECSLPATLPSKALKRSTSLLILVLVLVISVFS